MNTLQAFPFHYKLRDHFKKQTKTWEWFQNKNVQKEQIESFKTDLLKDAYRIDFDSDKKLYDILLIAKDKLGIYIPVTLYQLIEVKETNGSIVFFENEAHIMLSGSILKNLDDDELLALFGHELSHLKLYTLENGDFEITNRIINAIANDFESELFYAETARIFQLYTELFCDNGALLVTKNKNVVISTLVKISTGLEKVSAESYIKQAEEILSKMESGSTGETHPELFIRAKALELMESESPENIKTIEKIVNGKYDLQLLNIFSKDEIYSLTKKFISIILKPKWIQSEHNLVLCKQYFTVPTLNSTDIIDDDFKDVINDFKDNLKNYFCYVMYDFTCADRDITEPSTAHMLNLAEQLGLEGMLKSIIQKELKLTEKAFKTYVAKCNEVLNQFLESDAEASY